MFGIFINDLIEGFEDVGIPERSSKIAKYASIFMVRRLYYHWKLPVGYVVTEKGMSGQQIKLTLKSCIQSLNDVGLTVKAVVCDQSTTNSKRLKELGVNVETPYFFSESGEKIFAFFEHSHLSVSLAAQVSSHTTSSALKTTVSTGHLKTETGITHFF